MIVRELHEKQAQRVGTLSNVWIGLMFLGFAVLLGRVVQLKMAPDEKLAETAGSPFSSRADLGRRGDILDRRGRKIASSAVGYRLFIDPKMVDDIRTIAVRLGHLLEMDPVEIDKTIIPREESRYVVISHLLEDWQVEAVRQAGMPGVALEPRLVRSYPGGETGALLVGKVGFEHEGQGGAEYFFNDDLLPSNGLFTYLRDANGRPLWVEPAGYVPRQDGEEVRLSIDLVIQEIAESRLDQEIERMNAGGGRVIVMDVSTGEILAIVDRLRERKGWDEYTTDPGRKIHPALGRSRNATDPFEPGSTFKPFIWSVATENGRATPEEELDTPSGAPYRTSRGRAIRDVKYYGPMSWEMVLVKSLNSGMAIVAERMTEKEMQGALERFGFGSKTLSQIPGESGGIVTPPKRWGHYSQTSVCIGQEIGVTPLQMVRAFSAFARDGTLVEPTITTQNRRGPRVEVIRRAIEESTALETRRVLRKVMTDGTGRNAQSELYDIFGKSGTPQLPKKNGKGYHEDRYMPNFIGAAPYREPKIIVYCVLDDPDKSKAYHGGGATAGPVVRDIIEQTLTYLGVQPDHAPKDVPPMNVAVR